MSTFDDDIHTHDSRLLGMYVGYVTKRDELVETANDLFDVVAKGAVKIGINQSYALKDAAQAHRDLEARKTTGSTVFTL